MELNNTCITLNHNKLVVLTFDVNVRKSRINKQNKFTLNANTEFYLQCQCQGDRDQHYIEITVKFVNLSSSDQQTSYCLKLSSTEENSKYISIVQTDTWFNLYTNYENYINFNLTVTVDTAPCSSLFATLHDNTELTDFELRGEDGSVHIHRAILAVSSPVFKQMLVGTWRETKEGRVELKVSTATLQHFKDYIYLGIIPETGLTELLSMAQCYMMPELERKCVFKLFDNILTVEKEDQKKKSEGNDIKPAL